MKRRAFAFFCALPFLVLCVCAAPCAGAPGGASARDVAVTSPLLNEVVSFIGGRRAKVRSLSVLNADGSLSVVSRPKRNELIIAFNVDEAKRFKISSGNKNLRALYNLSPRASEETASAFFDPATLPFVAQEVMKTLSKEDEEHYAYYQRRLAEFQSLIDSAKGVGRHILSGVDILDLTGAEGAWVRSAVSGAVRPPKSVWDGWLAGDAAALRAALDEASRRGWLLLLDPWTPDAVRNAAVSYPYRLTLPVPTKGTDFFVFLQEIFNIILNKTKEKNAGGKK